MSARTPSSPPRLTVQDGLIVGLALVAIAQAALFIRMEKARPPEIVTVGVRQITQEYVSRLATSNVSQEEARIRTELYLALAQDTIRRLSVQDGVLVVARECVLAGEHADLTPQVSKAVRAAFDQAAAAGRAGHAR
jgi:hypothetical protein